MVSGLVPVAVSETAGADCLMSHFLPPLLSGIPGQIFLQETRSYKALGINKSGICSGLP